MSRIRYNVDMVEQQSSPVCWLACTAMLIQFKRGCTLQAKDLGFSERNDFRQHQVPSYGAAEWEHMRRLGLINSRISEGLASPPPPTMNDQARNQPENQHANWRNLIYDQLRTNGPFILHHYSGSFSYGAGVNTPRSGGHAVLIVGTDTVEGRTWFNNPWGQSSVLTTTKSIIGAIERWERGGSEASISYMR